VVELQSKPFLSDIASIKSAEPMSTAAYSYQGGYILPEVYATPFRKREEDGGLFHISVSSVLRPVLLREFFRNVLHFPVNPGKAEICLSQAESGNSICFAGNRCGAN
jgi:hypothetical protein